MKRCTGGVDRLRVLLAWTALFLLTNPAVVARSSSKLPLAGIFGFRGNNENGNSNESTSTTSPPRQPALNRPPPPMRPPPPGASYPTMGGPISKRNVPAGGRQPPPRTPPPPPKSAGFPTNNNSDETGVSPDVGVTGSAETNDAAEHTDKSMDLGESGESPDTKSREQPPPPPPRWGMDPTETEETQKPPQGWMAPQQQVAYGEGWGQAPYYDGQNDGNQFYLQAELDASLAREGDLLAHLDNLTSTVIGMEQREELHVRQLDVLTERVMDVEAQAAEDRNMLVEYEANCTDLALQLGQSQEEIEEWVQRCNVLTERQTQDEEKLEDLRRRIRAKETEAEELAIAIEHVRLSEKRREASELKRKHKRRGLFSWMLSWLVPEKDTFEEMSREEAFDMAKSTLLKALQQERGSVHELESAVGSLQQNNSAISEMVESRDSIIDELNSRIAVFEEDKVVLKAALRQLQKEIKEEAPKAQQLLDDLANAEQEIKRLKAEMNGVIQTHQEEVIALQQTVSSKQQAISETESNLTAIGTYVDKLEERLTSFAVTRRDMEEREKLCKEIEESATKTEVEKKELEVKVEEYIAEQGELKKLLEELAVERADLQKDNRKLYTEREFRIGEQEQLQAKFDALESEMKTTSENLFEWRSRCENLLPELDSLKTEKDELSQQLAAAEEIRQQLEESRATNGEGEEELASAKEELLNLKEENSQLSSVIETHETNIASFETKTQALEEELRKARAKTQEKSQPNSQEREKRNVPLRGVRKQLSKATGMHGLITPSSRMVASKSQPKAPPRPLPRLPQTEKKEVPVPPPIPQV